jgi:hypothetical protein
MLMPLLGVGLQVSFQFAVVESLKKYFKSRYADPLGNLHWKYSFLCGAIAGLPSAMIVVTDILFRQHWITQDSEF